ncbi:hypothetical protein TIFTF001_002992 [Ficus carica]|uniref:Uncharacterized protein n=1 Tax=Ficus carica TaxID=3494 RepID=A0AA87ZQ29_FICCA|nr:hypothetical protein TIFTF001_002992 [Ficus carica]
MITGRLICAPPPPDGSPAPPTKANHHHETPPAATDQPNPPPTPRPSTSTSRGRRPPSTSLMVTGCRVDGAGVRRGARTICNPFGCRFEIASWRGLAWTAHRGTRMIYNPLVADLKSRVGGGGGGSSGRRRSSEGAWTIYNLLVVDLKSRAGGGRSGLAWTAPELKGGSDDLQSRA